MPKDMADNKCVYAKIAKLMEEQNITKRILAKRTGITYNTIRSYISSGSNIPLKKLQKIAKALDVSTSYLLGEEECFQEKKQLQDLLSDIENITSKMSKILESK